MIGKLKKLFKNYRYYALRTFFNIPYSIALISLVRFIYFYYIKKTFKSFYAMDSKPEEMGFQKDKQITSLQHNTDYLKNHLKNLGRRFKQFNADRSDIPLRPLMALDFPRFINMKVLSIGPRMESELFKLVSYGFQLKNIHAIDIQSYSKLIDLGDMIKMPYRDSSFDLIIIGWVLTYSNVPDKAISEVIRVAKNNCLISMCHSHVDDFENKGYSNYHLNSSEVVLNLFKNNIGYTYFKNHPFDEGNKRNNGRSNFLIKIKKK
tara:strand:+ start:836 stop:1624 length:789 start_codon:yes stop_codon:yes gene_type:complete